MKVIETNRPIRIKTIVRICGWLSTGLLLILPPPAPAESRTIKCVGKDADDYVFTASPCPPGGRAVKTVPPDFRMQSKVKDPLAKPCFLDKDRRACEQLQDKLRWTGAQMFQEEVRQSIDDVRRRCKATLDAKICDDAACPGIYPLLNRVPNSEYIACAKYRGFPYGETWAKLAPSKEGRFNLQIGIVCLPLAGKEPHDQSVYRVYYAQDAEPSQRHIRDGDPAFASRTRTGKRFHTLDEAARDACRDLE